jgi:hypothetical protein
MDFFGTDTTCLVTKHYIRNSDSQELPMRNIPNNLFVGPLIQLQVEA